MILFLKEIHIDGLFPDFALLGQNLVRGLDKGDEVREGNRLPVVQALGE